MTDARLTVLVVDDTPANIQLVSAILRAHYRVKAATSGEKALAIASAGEVPDVIVLDVLMPEMDGYEVCRRLRAGTTTAGIPVIFLSASTEEADREQGLALGARGFLAKPVDPDELLALVRTCIEG